MLFFCLPLIAQQKFSISGTIFSQYKGADIRLSSDDSSFAPINVKEKNGKFYFHGEIKKEYEPVHLSVEKDNVYLGSIFLFIGAQDMKIDIVKLNKNDDALNEFRFSNVLFSKEQEEYKRLTKPSKDSAKAAFNIYYDVKRGYTKGYNQDSLWTIVSDLRKKLLVKKIKFIESFPNSYFSLYMFNKEIVNGFHPITIENLKTIYDKLDNNVKETDLGKTINEYINKKISLTVGHVLPDFSFTTDKGENYELSSFCKSEKYVLLCFWGSGCAPCIKKFPTLKMLNEKYKSRGLQLISISLETSIEGWSNSLKKYELPWLQTLDSPIYIHGNRIQDLLEVRSMPQYFLIDSTGKLVYHNEQSNDDDELNMLQQLLETQLQ